MGTLYGRGGPVVQQVGPGGCRRDDARESKYGFKEKNNPLVGNV